ncbi:hypothetical protein [Streptomyces uncialis]|uniref:hypothetical protein n=1 Tax=Streptomyces uncialis TaxID=1048205 RepID=UPI0033C4E358
MSSSQVWTAVALVVVLAWSTAMVVMGYDAALAGVLPSVGLLVQQAAPALTRRGTRQPSSGPATGQGDQEETLC